MAYAHQWPGVGSQAHGEPCKTPTHIDFVAPLLQARLDFDEDLPAMDSERIAKQVRGAAGSYVGECSWVEGDALHVYALCSCKQVVLCCCMCASCLWWQQHGANH